MTSARQQKEKDPIAAEDYKWLTEQASRNEKIRELVLAEETEDTNLINSFYEMTDAELAVEIARRFRPL